MNNCVPTLQDLQNLGADVETVAKFANDPAGEPNVNRAGNDVGNLETLREEALEIASDAANLQTYISYDSPSARRMVDDTSQPPGTQGDVTDDTDPAKNGRYTWDGSAWIKNPQQPIRDSDVADIRENADLALVTAYSREPNARALLENATDEAIDVVVNPLGYPVDGATAIKLLNDKITGGQVGTTSVVRFRKVTANGASIYQKGIGGNNWIEYPFLRQQNGATSQGEFSDLWRIVEAYETDPLFGRLRLGPIINQGEWECAIREPSPSGGVTISDAVGGYHGNEYQDESWFMIDGIRVPTTWTGDVRCGKLEFVQRSTIFRYGGAVTPIAEHIKHYTFEANRIRLLQRLDWLISNTLTYAMFPMMPMRRLLLGETGDQITDTAFRHPSFVLEDVATAGFSQIFSQNSKYIELWGETSGISVRMDFHTLTINGRPLWGVPDGDPGSNENARLYIANPTEYNKIYMDFGRDCPVAPGDVWESDVTYTINTTN